MDHRVILFFASYNGRYFHGWQQQANGLSVSTRIEEALAILLRKSVRVVGASRTDRDVHALGQAAVFRMSESDYQKMKDDEKNNFSRLLYSLNAMLGPHIFIHTLYDTRNPTFNVRMMSRRKAYLYLLRRNESTQPLFPYTYRVLPRFDVKRFRSILSVFAGEHDFRSFGRALSTKESNTVRRIYPIKVQEKKAIVSVHIMGNGFLHNQIRIMIGTAVQLTQNTSLSLPEAKNWLYSMLAAKQRQQAGKTAPGYALFLRRVYFPKDIWPQLLLLARADK